MSNLLPLPALLTPTQVADIVGVTEHTLAVWRCTWRYDLPYTKIGRRVRYKQEDVARFIEANRKE